MASGWTTISDLVDEGQNVSDKLDSAFANLDADIVDDRNRLTDLENTNFYNFDYVKESGITIVDDSYEQVANLVTPVRAVGKYKINLSMIFTINSTVNAAYFRFSLDGGATWKEMRKEAKDVTDNNVNNYTLVLDHTVSSVIDIQIEARKESAGDVLTIDAIDVMCEHKA